MTAVEWFPCYPDKLLGALASMTPVEGYVYTVVLLRMYESGGVFVDSISALARRCGISQNKTSKILETFFSAGRLRKDDDGIHNPRTDKVIKDVQTRKLTAKKRWKKDQSNQQMDPINQCTMYSVLCDSSSDSKEKWNFDDFWIRYPHKVGKGKARDEFERVQKKNIVKFTELMLGLARYAAKTDDRPWCNPSTWLHQERWTDIPATTNGGDRDKRSISKATDKLVQWADERATSGEGGQSFNGIIPHRPIR